jgi:hypothetical protein|tara:strand:- start:202 stop:405 length:204 start_codon:yes stop_codon:yes gene_type:complete
VAEVAEVVVWVLQTLDDQEGQVVALELMVLTHLQEVREFVDKVFLVVIILVVEKDQAVVELVKLELV